MKPIYAAFSVSLVAMCVGSLALAGKSKPVPAARKITYAKDIAPILNRSCVSCHHPGEVAPFSLVGYENAKRWSTMISKVASTRQMPPWKAAPGYGDLANDSALSAGEISALAAWSKIGAPEGPKAEEPPAPKFESGWNFGTPDVQLQMPRPFKLAAEGPDVYRNFVLHIPAADGPLWINAIDVKPGNKKVVHHVIAFIDAGHSGQKLADGAHDGQDGYATQGGGVGFLPSGTLGGWVPGSRPIRTPAGTAILIPAGADIVLQVHYHKSGKAEEDQTRIGLYLAKEPVEKQIRLAWILNFALDIPPGDKAYHTSQIYTVPADATLYGVTPHMHLLGRSMKAHALLPDGSVVPLVDVEDWDFNWQLSYRFKHPIKLPARSKIFLEGTYDNSSSNPHNPNSPPRRIRWGEQTTDEMFLLVAAYTLDSESLHAVPTSRLHRATSNPLSP